jgi:uncharacterized protein YegP (UPF0339 family)
MYTVEIHKSRKFLKQRFYWLVRHTNGQPILISEMYRSYQSAYDTANRFAFETNLTVIGL